ncbi:barstar family protein [Paenibacillus sp. FA6]|uniref:barstar family protein n=1 Tax=Paenibacillus sp. FA6 TaxID=3413029 RepID=UPI003F654CEA
MENKIHYVSFNEMIDIKKMIENDNSLYIAEIDSSDVQQLPDFLTTMSSVFQFPFPSRSIDSYNDWMRDLDWLNKDGYVLFIYSYKDFLSQDLLSQKAVIDGFSSVILPFWQEEVTEVVVEGKAKPFIIYLVE